MFENCQTDPKAAQILSTRPSQFLPAQSNSKPPNCAGTHDKRTDQYLAQWHYARISRRSLPAAGQRGYQLPLKPEIQPNLWLMVNPSLACPIKYPSNYPRAPTPTRQSALPRTTTPVLEKSLRPAILPDETCLNESVHETSLSSEYQFTDEEDASSVDVPVCRKVKGVRKGRTPKASTRKLGLMQNRRLQRALQDSINLKSGGWPRPPVNYCILIAMAHRHTDRQTDTHTQTFKLQGCQRFCVSKHCFKSMEEIPGDRPLHEASWTGTWKGNRPAAGAASAPLCEEARALPNDLQQATGVNVSDQTVRNRLHEGGVRA
uniref:Forkhead box R1 n=1 Tax=Sinocyclocheilus anshuiensis TaxID=1608454 RepID=A0A671NWY6_9TELE